MMYVTAKKKKHRNTITVFLKNLLRLADIPKKVYFLLRIFHFTLSVTKITGYPSFDGTCFAPGSWLLDGSDSKTEL